MKYSFIGHWISCDGVFKYVQLIENEEFSRKVTSRVIPGSELRNIYNDKDCFNFTISDSGYVSADVNLLQGELPEKMVNSGDASYFEMKPACRSIYDLLEDLMEKKSYFLYDTGLDDLDNIQEYVSRFIPKYSQSTMSVYFTALNNGEWRSKKIVYAEGSKLKANPFYVITSDPNPDPELEFIQEINLFNETAYIMRYNCTLPLLVYNHHNVMSFDPVINKYAYMSLVCKNQIKAVNYIKNLYFPSKEKSNKSYVHRMDLSKNITFVHKLKDITKKNFQVIHDRCFSEILPMVQKTQDPSTVTKFFDGMSGLEKNVYLPIVLLCTKTKWFDDKVALLDLCYKYLDSVERSKAKYDAFLYGLRVDAFLYDDEIHEGELKLYKGGDISSYTVLTRKCEGSE